VKPTIRLSHAEYIEERRPGLMTSCLHGFYQEGMSGQLRLQRWFRHHGGRDRWRPCAEPAGLTTAAGHQIEPRGLAAGPAGVPRGAHGAW